jgi:drug/metabolite transporter (DMT)-like permease
VRTQRIQIYAAVAATLLFWASAFVGIRALGEQLDPGPLALGRLIIATAILGIAVLKQRHRLPARRDTLRLALGGALWPGSYFVLLNASERHIDAATASVLVKLAPIMVALVAVPTLGERRSMKLFAGSVTALGGVAIVGFGGHGDAVGAGLAVAAAGAYAAGVVVQKPVLTRTTPLAATWIGTTAGLIVCLPFAPALVYQAASMPAQPFWWLLYLGVFPTAVAFTTWAYSLKHLPASRLTTTTYAIPVLTVVLSWAWIGETPPARAYVGGLVCIAGVLIALPSGRMSERRLSIREQRLGDGGAGVEDRAARAVGADHSRVAQRGEVLRDARRGNARP